MLVFAVAKNVYILELNFVTLAVDLDLLKGGLKSEAFPFPKQFLDATLLTLFSNGKRAFLLSLSHWILQRSNTSLGNNEIAYIVYYM